MTEVRLARFFSTVAALVIAAGFSFHLFSATPAFAAAPLCALEAPALSRGRAPSSTSTGSNGITVIQIDPALPAQDLRSAGYDVKTAEDFDRADAWAEPSPRLRDRLFAEAGLVPYLRRMDHLTKDILFLRAQEDSLAQLTRRYPTIPARALVILQQLILGEKGAQK